MTLTKYKIGQLIELVDEKNYDGVYTLNDVKGISTEKKFIDTKANMDGVSLNSYKVVNPSEFAYVPDTSRRGDKIAVAYNDTKKGILISSIYTTFKVSRPDLLLSDYLFIYFNRPEFDRYARFNSWGSARETFDWADFCDITITLPSIATQRHFVDFYCALQNNLSTYQSNLDDLKLTCDAFIENLRKNITPQPIAKFIEECDEKNTNSKYGIDDVVGVSINKEFIDTKADMNGVPLTNYKVIRKGMFAFNVNTARMGDKFAIALCDSAEHIVSSIYGVFRSKDENKLIPEYLMMFINRPDFDRYARFHSWGSAREVFTMDDMKEVKIPIPNIDTQRQIVNIYNAYIERQRIAAELKATLNNLCPILIQGSLQTEY